MPTSLPFCCTGYDESVLIHHLFQHQNRVRLTKWGNEVITAPTMGILFDESSITSVQFNARFSCP
jgi:hypothetical protein